MAKIKKSKGSRKVEILIPDEVDEYINKVAKLSGATINDVLCVILAIYLVKAGKK